MHRQWQLYSWIVRRGREGCATRFTGAAGSASVGIIAARRLSSASSPTPSMNKLPSESDNRRRSTESSTRTTKYTGTTAPVLYR